MATYDRHLLDGEHLAYYTGKVKTLVNTKQDTLVFNTAYSAESNKAATMSDVNTKQDTLVFGTEYSATTNKAATMTDIQNAIGSIATFSFEIVETLPETGASNKIYLVLRSSGSTGNIYTEWAWINSAWETIGDTSISLEYLTNSEIDTIWGNL